MLLNNVDRFNNTIDKCTICYYIKKIDALIDWLLI